MNRTVLVCGLVVFLFAFLVPPYEAVNIHAEAGRRAAQTTLGLPAGAAEREITHAVIAVGPSEGWYRDARIAGDLWLATLFGIAALTFGAAVLFRPARRAP